MNHRSFAATSHPLPLLLLSFLLSCGNTDEGAPDLGTDRDAGDSDAGRTDLGPVQTESAVPSAVAVARATTIPACSVFVDGASAEAPDGSAERPFLTMTAALEASERGAVVCVAEGTYPEALAPGEKDIVLAGGFQSGSGFTVRDSAMYVTRAQGDGTNTFFRVEDPAPGEGILTAIDGFEITGYAQGIVRNTYYPQRFDITNCYIHDNNCADPSLNGAAFYLDNVSGTIARNVLARNTCGRGGGGAVYDSTNTSRVVIERNLVEANAGDEPGISHGGGLYLLANELEITGNLFRGNTVTGWGGGLYVGAVTGGGQYTTAVMRWNVYRDNRAGGAGGGFFCDDSASCRSEHELYDSNCGGNIFLDSGLDDAPTVAIFEQLTSYRGLEAGCDAPGAGVLLSKNSAAADAYSFRNAIFWGSAVDRDLDLSCDSGCASLSFEVAYAIVQTRYGNNGVNVVFSDGILGATDPRFVDPAAQNFHLRSTFGHWTPAGYVEDDVDSPALGAGDPGRPAPNNLDRAGDRAELGTYGDSVEASYVR